MDALLEQLLAAETTVWEALRTSDAAADRAALADDFLGVSPAGFSGPAEHAAALTAGPAVSRYRLEEARAMALGEEYGLIAYRADYQRPGGTAEESMYVASVWRRRDGGWANVFSQDTKASDAQLP